MDCWHTARATKSKECRRRLRWRRRRPPSPPRSLPATHRNSEEDLIPSWCAPSPRPLLPPPTLLRFTGSRHAWADPCPAGRLLLFHSGGGDVMLLHPVLIRTGRRRPRGHGVVRAPPLRACGQRDIAVSALCPPPSSVFACLCARVCMRSMCIFAHPCQCACVSVCVFAQCVA